jgi:Zn-finger protein
MLEQSSSQEEKNSSNNVEQAREVESIDQALVDNQIGFSFESLYFQSKTSIEEDSLSAQGEYPHSCNSCSNQHLKSVIEEHLSDENLLECSSTPMELIREEVTQLEEETLNLHPQNALCSPEILDVGHINFELSITQKANLDEHIMLKNSSESFKESEENHLENTIVEYHSSRDSFHLLISHSFYSLYPDLFLDSSGLDILPTTPYSLPTQSYPFDMLNFGEINSEHNIDKTGFDSCSLSSLIWEEDMLQDDFTQFIVEKDNALYFMEIKHSKFM